MKSLCKFMPLLVCAILISGTPLVAAEDPDRCDFYGDIGCTPILIDLENDGIHLTGLEDPVWFDIDADGAPDLLSWTDRSEGFLALDRNGNGDR